MQNENENENETLTGPSRWRAARCDDCGWEIEINEYGDRTLCACDVSA